MKKLALLLAALSACFALSCSKEGTESRNEGNMKPVVISASVSDILKTDGSTRTTYAGGTTFAWSAGDKISVLGSDHNFYTFTATASGTTSTFSGTLPDGVSLGSYAFFPADAGHAYDGLKFSIPETMDLRTSGFAAMPMVGDKGANNSYSFMHCSGALKLQLTNIHSSIEYVTVTVQSASLKLSGLFGVFKSGGEWRYNADAGSNDSEKTYTRTVNVTAGYAEVYIPYAWGANMWANSTLTVTGYDSSDNPHVLISGKTLKGDSTYNFARAHVRPLTPLVVSAISLINWDGITGISSDGNYSAFKMSSDDYYIYLYSKVKKESINWGGDSGGESGTYIYYCLDTDNDSSTGNDLWGNVGFEKILLTYPFGGSSETPYVRTDPYFKETISSTKPSKDVIGTIETGEGAMVEVKVAVLRTVVGISSGTTIRAISYGSSNVSQYLKGLVVDL